MADAMTEFNQKVIEEFRGNGGKGEPEPIFATGFLLTAFAPTFVLLVHSTATPDAGFGQGGRRRRGAECSAEDGDPSFPRYRPYLSSIVPVRKERAAISSFAAARAEAEVVRGARR